MGITGNAKGEDAAVEAPTARRSQSFIRQFIALAGPYWTSEEKWKARGLLALLVALTVVQIVIQVWTNLWNAKLFDALEQRSMANFFVQILVFLAILAAGMTVTATHLFIKRRIQLNWRRWLTQRMLDRWMSAGHQFQVNYMPGEHDNPDGRIAEDVRVTTEAAIDLGHSLFYCILLLVSFVKILWSLSGPLEFDIGPLRLSVPGHMVWVALIYSTTATSLALLVGWPLIRVTDKRQTAEANFRFGLVRGRENAEAIALLNGENDENRRLGNLLQGIRVAWERQTGALVRLYLFTSGYSILSTAFPILIAAPRFIAGTITLGALMQTAQAFQQLASALSWPVDNLQRGAEWRASVERVLALSHALEDLEHSSPFGENAIAVVKAGGSNLSFQNLCITNPDGGTVFSDFSAEVAPGERVLISGDPIAAIKLFKVVAGLWPWGHGRVELPTDANIFFMPQRPYLPIGRLRNAVSYPADPDVFDKPTLCDALKRVGLFHLCPRLDETQTWEQVLTASEQQRLGFARLLLHRPDWIFIEEATDALDTEGEEDMMRLLQAEFPRATVLTIGYHATLDAFHDRKLLPRERRIKTRAGKRRKTAAV